MRSQFADTFNHDADAPGYDEDVKGEAHPIRAGYADLLAWVAQNADIAAHHRVLELGAGTGNLTALLAPAARIVAVDISQQMLELARAKCTGPVTWVHNDLLAFFDESIGDFDRVVSTYAIHHLLADEKLALFQRIRQSLSPGGCAVFGDLMFESREEQRRALDRYRDRNQIDVVDAIDSEFFWLLDECVPALRKLGFSVATRRFSDLSWGLRATAN